MFKRVLVPMDGSESTERILHHLVQVTNWCDSELTLLHVLQRGVSRPSTDLQVEYPNVLADRAQGLAREYFSELVAQLEKARVPTRATTATGEIVETVVARAHAGRFDLMALTVSGRHPALRRVTGSVSERIRVRSPIPMLILNGLREARVGRANVPLTRLMVALNGTRVSEFALPYARRVARAANLPITLLRVVPEIATYTSVLERAGTAPRFVADARRVAERYLERHATLLAEEGFGVTTRVEVGPVARTIADVQHGAPDHLLVMSSVARRGGWQRAVLGCTADELIRSSGRPLLLIPAGKRPLPKDDDMEPATNGRTGTPTPASGQALTGI